MRNDWSLVRIDSFCLFVLNLIWNRLNPFNQLQILWYYTCFSLFYLFYPILFCLSVFAIFFYTYIERFLYMAASSPLHFKVNFSSHSFQETSPSGSYSRLSLVLNLLPFLIPPWKLPHWYIKSISLHVAFNKSHLLGSMYWHSQFFLYRTVCENWFSMSFSKCQFKPNPWIWTCVVLEGHRNWLYYCEWIH